MNPRPTKDKAASVRQRLLNLARSGQRPFNELLQYYAMERFLYRLSRSVHADRFILKGALMLRVWDAPQARPTMDIDLLGRTSNEVAAMVAQIRDILATEVDADGLVFAPDTIQAERITEDADYEGVRIRFLANLDTARITMQVDVGFGDIVFPAPLLSTFPTLLDDPAPRLLGYSRESAIAEKFEALVKLGEINSRMKDYYDIWMLSRQFDFRADLLAEAIHRTLTHRGTELPEEIAGLSDRFAATKQTQWSAFRRRLEQEHVPVAFSDIVDSLRRFLAPALPPKSGAILPALQWTAPGPWQ